MAYQIIIIDGLFKASFLYEREQPMNDIQNIFSSIPDDFP